MTTDYGHQRPRRQPPVVSLAGLRRSHGFTLQNVVDRIDEATSRRYTVGAISAIELGYRGPSAQMLDDIAGVFGLVADDLTVPGTHRTEQVPA